MNFKIALSFMLIGSIAHGMQAPKKSEPENHPRSTICFLHQYVRAHFCDVDEKGVYFSEINPDESDVSFILLWPQVKTVLETAFSDIKEYTLPNERAPLAKDYREAIEQVAKFHEQPRIEWGANGVGVFNVESENRNLYKGTLLVGDAALVKSALKSLKLSSTHNA